MHSLKPEKMSVTEETIFLLRNIFGDITVAIEREKEREKEKER
jgi:hypothetical protein